MLVLVCSCLALMALVSYLASGKRLLFPPVVFNSVWTFALAMIGLRPGTFYAISVDTLEICLLGSCAFTAGSFVAFYGRPHKPRPKVPRQQRISRIVQLSCLGVPVFAWWLNKTIIAFGDSDSPILLSVARSVLLNTEKTFEFTLFSNIAYFAIPVAMLAVAESEGHKRRAQIAFVIAFLMNALTGARSGLVLLVLSCLAIGWLKKEKVNRRLLISGALAFVLIFGLVTVLTARGDANVGQSTSDNIWATSDVFSIYASGPIVAFDRVVREKDATEHSEHITDSIAKISNFIGFRWRLPDLGSGYVHWVTIGPHQLSMNAYTMYFPYYEYGIAGVMGLCGFIGFISTASFMRALGGSKLHRMLYPMFFAYTVLSIFGEYFFMGLPFLLRTMIVAWLGYRTKTPVQRLPELNKSR